MVLAVSQPVSLTGARGRQRQGTWRRLAETLSEMGHGTGADDLLDALSLALTASAPADEFHQLPPNPPTDATGIPMQMVYRRPEPFDIDD